MSLGGIRGKGVTGCGPTRTNTLRQGYVRHFGNTARGQSSGSRVNDGQGAGDEIEDVKGQNM